MSLLVAGGFADPNLAALADAARGLGVPIVDLRHGTQRNPAFHWRLPTGLASLDGVELHANGAFIRYDVFGAIGDNRPEVSVRSTGWFHTIHAWLHDDPKIRLFNRHADERALGKPNQLIAAHRLGLRVPETVITNEIVELSRWPSRGAIAKPVAGGDFCYGADELRPRLQLRDGVAAMPAIVQPRLVGPEVRIYVIGKRSFAFRMETFSLDYRRRQDVEIVPLAAVPNEAVLLHRFMSELGIDFGAADFKTEPETGELHFLELNSSPMFARFDLAAGGALTRAMVEQLVS